MGSFQFRSKQNADWARMKKPSLPTLLISYATPKQENILCHKKNHHRPASVLKKIKSVGAISRPMSAIEFSIESLNEIWMMSITKCSIGVIRWCFLFRPRSVISRRRRQLSFFSINFREWCFFCAGVGYHFLGRLNENTPMSAETQPGLSSQGKT